MAEAVGRHHHAGDLTITGKVSFPDMLSEELIAELRPQIAQALSEVFGRHYLGVSDLQIAVTLPPHGVPVDER